MGLKEAGIEAGTQVLAIFREKAGDLWSSLTDPQKNDVTACLVALGEDGILSLAGDEDAKKRITVNINTLNDYKLKSGIVAARLAVESLREALEATLKIVITVALAAAK